MSRNPFDVMDQATDQATGPAFGQATDQAARAASRLTDRTEAIAGEGRIAAGFSAADGHEIQVGYQDPVLGYVELRAHVDANGVHASLEAQSAAAGDTLTGHLNELAGWMNERHTPLESLTVSTPASQTDTYPASHGESSRANGQGAEMHFSNHGGSQGGGASSGQNPETSSGIEAGSLAAPSLAQRGSVASFATPELPGGSSFSVVA